MLLWEAPMLTEVGKRACESVGNAANLALLLCHWFCCHVRRVVITALGDLLDALEFATTGWTSPPLPGEVPGPRGLPFVGYLPFVGRLPHKTLGAIADRFAGRLFRLSAGSRRFVVVSRIDTLRTLSTRFANQLRSKPQTFTTQQMTVGAHNDMLQRWKRRRGYTDAGLRQIQKTTNGDILHDEVAYLTSYISSLSGSSDVRHDVTLSASRVMYRLAYGRCPDEPAVEALRHIVHSLPDYTTTIGSLSWFDCFPVWRIVCRSTLAKFLQFNKYISAFCRTETRRSLDRLDGELDDEQPVTASLFEFFRQKIGRLSDAERSRFALSEDVLFGGLEDVIRAGTESSSLVTQWFLLYAAAFPEVQRRLRQELDELVGCQSGRELTAEDVRQLPYCRAAFAEACRFSSINPFLKRELTDDVDVDGVRLARGTVLLFNVWAINNDRRNWTDPERFVPDRFLTADGQFDEDKMALLVPFGFGKRRCIGVETGRALCMLIVASLVRQFHITLDPDDPPDFDPVLGIGLAPRPYRLRFELRPNPTSSV